MQNDQATDDQPEGKRAASPRPGPAGPIDIAAAMKQLASDYLSRAVAARNSESIEFEKAVAQLRK